MSLPHEHLSLLVMNVTMLCFVVKLDMWELALEKFSVSLRYIPEVTLSFFLALHAIKGQFSKRENNKTKMSFCIMCF